jgi:hypothetical protein
MARGNQSERNLRSDAQAQLNDPADEQADEQAGIEYGNDIAAGDMNAIGDETGPKQTGTASGTTAIRTKATPKTAAQQSTSMQNKKGNQPPNR